MISGDKTLKMCNSIKILDMFKKILHVKLGTESPTPFRGVLDSHSTMEGVTFPELVVRIL